MRIPSNKIKDVVRFFYDELDVLYSSEEIAVFVAYCFEEYLKLQKHEISLKLNDTISESELLKFNFAVKDLKKHKPIQYILGKAHFYGITFKVNEQVLIPRPETEELVDLIIKDKTPKSSILDIGTGSGCIAISLKKQLPQSSVCALDVSPAALSVARENAALQQVELEFIQQNILSPVSDTTTGQFDVIVSNPPYIRELEKKQMHQNVLNYEPHLALFVPDSNPLMYYTAIVHFAKNKLADNGKVYFEINEHMGDEMRKLLMDEGFVNVEIHKDLNGKNRILCGVGNIKNKN